MRRRHTSSNHNSKAVSQPAGRQPRHQVGLEVDQVVVDRRCDFAALRICPRCAVVWGGPDRNPATLSLQSCHIGDEALALPKTASSGIKPFLSGDQTVARCFEAVEFRPRGEDVICIAGHVAQRPGEQRGDDRFRNARRPVLSGDVLCSRNRERAAPRPRFKGQARSRQPTSFVPISQACGTARSRR